MIAAIRSELLKFFTTRMWWGMAIALFVAAALFAALFAFAFTVEMDPAMAESQGVPQPDPVQLASSVYTAGLTIGYTLTLVIGIMMIGSEYRHKTISGTFLAVPRRAKVMVAKILALLGIGAFYGVVSLLGSVSAGAVVLVARGADPFPDPEVARSLALSVLVMGLWALIGLGIGILIPNLVADLIISIGVLWVVEPIASILLSLWDFGRDHVVQFLPSMATNSMVGGVTQTGDQAPNTLEWWAGALVLIAYAAVLAAIGSWLTSRRDVS